MTYQPRNGRKNSWKTLSEVERLIETLMTADLDKHREHIQHFVDLGFTEAYVHNVGRNQREFIQAYGREVVPNIKWSKE